VIRIQECGNIAVTCKLDLKYPVTVVGACSKDVN
jgi:hypothetical protein